MQSVEGTASHQEEGTTSHQEELEITDFMVAQKLQNEEVATFSYERLEEETAIMTSTYPEVNHKAIELIADRSLT